MYIFCNLFVKLLDLVSYTFQISDLNKPSQIVELLSRVYNLPPSLPILEIDSSLQRYENFQRMNVTSNQSYAKEVTVPRGFPSMMTRFSEFKVWDRVINCLKIPSNRTIFKENFNQAVETFFEKYDKTYITEGIVFEVKREILRLNFTSVNIDHLFMEFVRGAAYPIVTGRIRKLTSIDSNGAILTPAQLSRIRSFEDNSFIDNLNVNLYGLIPVLYSLFSHSVQDDFYLLSLEKNLSPFKYGDKTTQEVLNKMAKLLGIKGSDIDFYSEEIAKGLTNMCNGAICEAFHLYEQNFAHLNLPRPVQAAFLENTIRLQNVGFLLRSKLELFHDMDKLTRRLQTVSMDHKTLMEICDCIIDFEQYNRF